MKKSLKMALTLISIILAWIIMTSCTFAITTGSITINQDKTQYNPGDTVVLTVGFENFSIDDDTIIDFGGKIEYNKEELELIDIKTNTVAGWAAAVKGVNFTENTGGFVFSYTGEKGAIGSTPKIFDITFKVKASFVGEAKVSITGAQVTGQGRFDSKDTLIKVVEPTAQQPDENNTQNENTQNSNTENNNTENNNTQNSNTQNNTQNNKDNTIKNDILPNTGISNTLWCAIIISIVAFAIATVRYINIKHIAKKEQQNIVRK